MCCPATRAKKQATRCKSIDSLFKRSPYLCVMLRVSGGRSQLPLAIPMDEPLPFLLHRQCPRRFPRGHLLLLKTQKNYAPSAPAAHIRVRLLLLPSGPDRVHAVISHGTRCVADIVYQTFIQITSAKYIDLQTMLFTGSRAAQCLPAQGFSAARRYSAQRRPVRAWLRPAPPPRP